ncbi:MAG: alpha-glucosidase [Bradymonadia bacterium]
MSDQLKSTELMPFNQAEVLSEDVVLLLGGYEITLSRHRSPLLIKSQQKIVFAALPSKTWLLGYHDGYDLPESRGFFFPKARSNVASELGYPTHYLAKDDALILFGEVSGFRWRLAVHVTSETGLVLNINTDFSRIVLTARRSEKRRVFGLGHQFSHVDLNGYRVPLISQEPGIGRGIQPLSFFMNLLFGAGGSDVQSSAPSSFFLTDEWIGYFLDSCAVAFVDFTLPHTMSWDINQGECRLRLYVHENPRDVLSEYTSEIGRMLPLPDWIHRGAIIGLQGGSDRLDVVHERLKNVEAKLAGYWLQDWIGQRKTSIGWQLWWNWELDERHYPRWTAQREALRSEGVRLMSYINPFLVDIEDKPGVRRDLYAEAVQHGYLVKSSNGEPYAIGNTSFNAYLVDLTNLEARAWLKSVIIEQVIGAGASGFMADFGEALPADAVLSDGRDAALYHNEYPIEWSRLIQEAIAESGVEDIVPFHRSAYHKSPAHTRLFWLGDQLVSWHWQDGIRSAVTGLVSGGLSGFSLSHSDIGGYTSTDLLPLSIKMPGVSFTRGQDLLKRWIELNAFTPIFRTHEGNQPSKNLQVFDTPEIAEFFGYFSRVFAALFDYRKSEMKQVQSDGYPLIRPLWFHHEDEEYLLDCENAFLLGRWICVYPVLERKSQRVEVTLPPGQYAHLFTGQIFGGGRRFTVDAPLGRPAVFIDTSSSWCRVLIDAISGLGPQPH